MRVSSNSERFGTDYEVFINFRGPDARQGIVSVLCEKMRAAGIRYFYDDESIRVCEEISGELKRAIEVSKMYIVIFSQNYASSKWCLLELTQMNNLRKSKQKDIFPIFHAVTEADVKLKTDRYQIALGQPPMNQVEPETVEEWKKALKEVGRIKGRILGETPLSSFCNEVVEAVLDRFQDRYVSYHSVGLKDKVKTIIEKNFEIESGDVRFLLIHGKSGIGKTTLAKVIYQQLSSHFEGCSFVPDIGSQDDGYRYLRDHVLQDIPDKYGEGRGISLRFRKKKVLIVLDNVNNNKQIEELNSTWFGPGSRIVITATSTTVLLSEDSIGGSKPKLPKEYQICGMERMKPDEALQLFSRHAFGEDSPPENYVTQSEDIIPYVSKLPLTIEILGSCLRRNRELNWDETRKKLINTSQSVTDEVISMSYNELKEEAQQIFLDIACLFVNKEKTNAVYMWKDRYTKAEVEDLIDASLVKIEENKLWMHDEVRNFGRGVVRREKDLGEHSRLWERNEALKVLRTGKAKLKVQALHLCRYASLDYPSFRAEQLGMKNLRYLRLYAGNVHGRLEALMELRWLCWNHCPRELKATCLYFVKLVVLDLSESSITCGWSGWNHLKEAHNLKILDLRSCKELTETPDLSCFQKLERLILEDCTQLTKINGSISKLQHLKCLNAKGCNSLVELPDGIHLLEALAEIIISKHTTDSGEETFLFPVSTGSLKSLRILEIVNVKFSDLPSFGVLEKLKRLTLLRCSMSGQLRPAIGQLEQLRSLVELDISHTTIDVSLGSIKDLEQLKVIKMENSSIAVLPSSIWMLKNLEEIHARNSTRLRGNVLELENEVDLGKLSPLRILDLSFTRVSGLLEAVRGLSLLQKLSLDSCLDLERLDELPRNLTRLNIEFHLLCSMQHLAELNNLVDLVILDSTNCPPQNMPDTVLLWMMELSKLQNLELRFPNSTSLLLPQISSFPELKSLKLSGGDLKQWSQLPCTLSRLFLEHVKVHNRGLRFPEFFYCLTYLELRDCFIRENSFRIEELLSLVHFSANQCCFSKLKVLRPPKGLRVLRLNQCEFCNTILDLSGLNDLQQLELSECNEVTYKNTMKWLRPMRWTDLIWVYTLILISFLFGSGLIKIQGLEKLESLQEVTVLRCNSLKTLCGLSNLKNLQFLDLEIYHGVLEKSEEKIIKSKKDQIQFNFSFKSKRDWVERSYFVPRVTVRIVVTLMNICAFMYMCNYLSNLLSHKHQAYSKFQSSPI